MDLLHPCEITLADLKHLLVLQKKMYKLKKMHTCCW